jgi:hypothetical protein
MTFFLNWSNAMNLMHEELARAQMSERLCEARAQRRERRLLMAYRLSERAERAAHRARLAAARAL